MTTIYKHNSFGWSSKRRPSGLAIDNHLLRLLPKDQSFTMVDLGFGDASFLCKVKQQHPLACLSGIERDSEGFQKATSLLSGMHLFNISIDQVTSPIYFQPQSFDFVLSSEVIEHLYDPSDLFKAASYLLKPSGKLIITTPYHGYLKNLCLSFMNKWDRHFHVDRLHGHIKFFSYSSLRHFALNNNFSPLSFRGIGRFPFLWKSMCMTFEITPSSKA